MVACRGIVLAAALLLAGCATAAPTATSGGVTPAAASPTPAIQPCSLITAADAAAALGQKVDAGTTSALAGVVDCIWSASDPASLAVVIVTVSDKGTYDGPLNGTADPSTIAKVSGVGDEAYFQTTPAGITLSLRKGNVYLTVDVEKASGQKDAEKTIGIAAAKALP